MKFIKLTTINGYSSFYINKDLIESFSSINGETKIFMQGSTDEEYYSVKETPEEILAILGQPIA